jgi:DNA-3-methyladenine glycosylase
VSGPPPAFDLRHLKALPREFFNRDPRRASRDLLGKVLVRRQAGKLLAGVAEMEKARGLEGAAASPRGLRSLTSGPGRLAEAFGITRPRDNDKDLTDAGSDLFLADDGYRTKRVLRTARVGITKAAEKPLRYVIAGNEFVSGKRVG